jgi:hypothetical protein
MPREKKRKQREAQKSFLRECRAYSEKSTLIPQQTMSSSLLMLILIFKFHSMNNTLYNVIQYTTVFWGDNIGELLGTV